MKNHLKELINKHRASITTISKQDMQKLSAKVQKGMEEFNRDNTRKLIESEQLAKNIWLD